MNIHLRDGSSVEIAFSGNGNPPDGQHGQHTNMSTIWWQVRGGPWERGSRSMHGTVQMAEMSDSADELRQLIESF